MSRARGFPSPPLSPSRRLLASRGLDRGRPRPLRENGSVGRALKGSPNPVASSPPPSHHFAWDRVNRCSATGKTRRQKPARRSAGRGCGTCARGIVGFVGSRRECVRLAGTACPERRRPRGRACTTLPRRLCAAARHVTGARALEGGRAREDPPAISGRSWTEDCPGRQWTKRWLPRPRAPKAR